MSRAAIGGILVTVALAGCASMKSGGGSKSTGEDPLLGGISPPPPQATAFATNPAVAPPPGAIGSLGRPTSGNEPLTKPTAASPAVLATGAYPPLAGGQDLRIGTPPPAVGGNRVLPKTQTPPGVLAVVTADPNYGQPGTASQATSPGVVPLDANGQRVGPVPLATGGLDHALAAVAALHPKWHRLEGSSPGTWRFSCSVPDKQEPSKSRTYEAEGPTALAAVQQVLDRINRGRD